MYTIKHAAEVTGLSPATLRAWERRYGVVAPHRTDSGYRLYDEDAVRALMVMGDLVSHGWSAREAAEETRRRVAATLPPATVRGADPAGPAPGSDGLVDAAARQDAGRLAAILDERFSRASFESVVDGWLMPSLVALGEAWADGRVSVAGEHLASQAVLRRLSAAYDASASETTGARIVLGMPPGVRHELGVLAFAVAARRAGLSTAYLGADLPAAEWVAAVSAHRPQAVVLSAPRESDLPALASVVAGLQAADPGLLIAVGGALQERAPRVCLRLGHEIGAAAALLAATLGAPDGSAEEAIRSRT